jgi:(p)ppGpp synthase/HD superfamily hydrolase
MSTEHPFNERLADALAYAVRAHHGQFRKGTSIPYISHLLAVSSLVMEHGGNEDAAIAALLHDVLEDCGAEHEASIRALFGDAVAKIVLDCTDASAEAKQAAGKEGSGTADERERSWYARKGAYVTHLRKVSAATLLVSACDKLHNARAIASDFATLGDAMFERFNAKKRGTQWYYRALNVVFAERLAGTPLARDLTEAIGRFAPPEAAT